MSSEKKARKCLQCHEWSMEGSFGESTGECSCRECLSCLGVSVSGSSRMLLDNMDSQGEFQSDIPAHLVEAISKQNPEGVAQPLSSSQLRTDWFGGMGSRHPPCVCCSALFRSSPLCILVQLSLAKPHLWLQMWLKQTTLEGQTVNLVSVQVSK